MVLIEYGIGIVFGNPSRNQGSDKVVKDIRLLRK